MNLPNGKSIPAWNTCLLPNQLIHGHLRSKFNRPMLPFRNQEEAISWIYAVADDGVDHESSIGL